MGFMLALNPDPPPGFETGLICASQVHQISMRLCSTYQLLGFSDALLRT